MLKRILTGTGALAALSALALGGSAIAISSAKQVHRHHAKVHRHAVEKATGTDKDNVQSGDQTTPDTGTAASSAESSAENSPESSSETGTPSDGPGGHADPAGSSVDHQFSGQE